MNALTSEAYKLGLPCVTSCNHGELHFTQCLSKILYLETSLLAIN